MGNLDERYWGISMSAVNADRLTPAAHSVDLAARLGRQGVLFEFTLLDKVGHMSNLEAVEDFNSAVARLDRSA